MKIYLYGPSGSGKSTVGSCLAKDLGIPFYDIDQEIEMKYKKSIREIFQSEGEDAFRAYESLMLKETIKWDDGVIALGGGALLRGENRDLVERAGVVICLMASIPVLVERVYQQNGIRPLLAGDVEERLSKLMAERGSHYASFPNRLYTDELLPQEASWEIQCLIGRFAIGGMGNSYDVRIEPDILSIIGKKMVHMGLKGPVAIVTDSNLAPIYGNKIVETIRSEGFTVNLTTIPAGENSKTIFSAMDLWKFFVESKMERGSTVIAFGGGVVGDLTGYVSSSYLRGVRWINIPTSLLAMVDSCLGGKTAINLPEGKNLIGAFHAPSGVFIDPNFIVSLPQDEFFNGMAEVIKHGVIGSKVLFDLCDGGITSVMENLTKVICLAVSVKVKIVREDPFETGLRQVLNFGHTIGHALESASSYELRHGESVAIGMVLETHLAETIGLADSQLSDKIASVLAKFHLPTSIPSSISKQAILEKIGKDKKVKEGKILFALPRTIGDVRYGIAVDHFDPILDEGV